ncbi:MAG: DUF6602 domain-containing protein [Zavarzinella sp.]
MTVINNSMKLIQQELNTKLAYIRECHRHSGIKGEKVEDLVRDFLMSNLPTDYIVREGEIIDSQGKRSKQIDTIITNNLHPRFENKSLNLLEGVAVCGEVKTQLTTAELERVFTNCKSAKDLKLSSSYSPVFGPFLSSDDKTGDLANSNIATGVPYFLVAFETSISITTLQQEIAEWNTNNPKQNLDAVFILDPQIVIINNSISSHTREEHNQIAKLHVNKALNSNDPCVLTYLASWVSTVGLEKRNVRYGILTYYFS